MGTLKVDPRDDSGTQGANRPIWHFSDDRLSPLPPPKRTSLLGEGKAESDPKRSYKELGNRSAMPLIGPMPQIRVTPARRKEPLDGQGNWNNS